MKKITLAIPNHRQKVRIIANSDLIQYELNEIMMEKKRFELKKELERETFAERKQKEVREELEKLGKVNQEDLEEIIRRPPPVYYREVHFANYDEPVQLSLDKVEEDTVPLSLAAEEIQKAYENGLHDGQLTARATYKTEIQKYRAWIKRIDSVVETLVGKHKNELKKMQSSLIELSTMIAEHIILEEIDRDRSATVNIVQEVIQELEGERVFSVFLHPDDIDIIKSARSVLFKDLPDALNIKILPDSSLLPGSVVLETTAGIVDGRITSKLRNIEANLNEEEERSRDTSDIESELKALYLEQVKEESKNEDQSEGRKQLERLKIEDPELYQELMESGEIEDESEQSEIIEEVQKIKAEKHHQEMAEEYPEDTKWDEELLEEFDERLAGSSKSSSNESDSPSVDDSEGDNTQGKDEEEDV